VVNGFGRCEHDYVLFIRDRFIISTEKKLPDAVFTESVETLSLNSTDRGRYDVVDVVFC